MEFSDEQLERYSRQIILKDVGGTGQEKLLKAKVLIIGAGGLGSPAALYLAAAGVGMIGIIDSDKVELSNLQRQILHFTCDVDKNKIDSAREKLTAINPDIKIFTYHEKVTSSNIRDLIIDYDFIIDGTDNFPSKFLINDACVMLSKPFSHAGVLRFAGQTLTYIPGETCYRCIFLEPPPTGVVPSCKEAGILGAVVGILGTIQATETLKFILGKGRLLINQLLVIDAFDMEIQKIAVKKNPDCPVCSPHPSITELKDYEQKVCKI